MADAHGSGPCVGNNMRVQVPSSALDIKKALGVVPKAFWVHGIFYLTVSLSIYTQSFFTTTAKVLYLTAKKAAIAAITAAAM